MKHLQGVPKKFLLGNYVAYLLNKSKLDVFSTQKYPQFDSPHTYEWPFVQKWFFGTSCIFKSLNLLKRSSFRILISWESLLLDYQADTRQPTWLVNRGEKNYLLNSVYEGIIYFCFSGPEKCVTTYDCSLTVPDIVTFLNSL